VMMNLVLKELLIHEGGVLMLAVICHICKSCIAVYRFFRMSTN
jgi:hypothetical protein